MRRRRALRLKESARSLVAQDAGTKILVAAPRQIAETRRVVMKLNPVILSLVVGFVLGILVGSWSNQRFGRDDMLEYVHGQW